MPAQVKFGKTLVNLLASYRGMKKLSGRANARKAMKSVLQSVRKASTIKPLKPPVGQLGQPHTFSFTAHKLTHFEKAAARRVGTRVGKRAVKRRPRGLTNRVQTRSPEWP